MSIFSDLIFPKLFYIILPIAILQVLFIPGILINFFFKYKTNFFSLILNSFAASLVLNYCIIFSFTILNIYNTYTIWLLIFIEFLIIFIFWKNIYQYIKVNIEETSSNFILLMNKNSINKFIFYICLILCGIFVINYIPLVKDKTNGYIQIFEYGDVIHHYSQHAISWFKGEIPPSSFLRPQLWFSNVSLIYIIFNNVYFEPFGKIIFLLVPLYILIGTLGFSISSKNIIYLFSGLIGLNIILTNTYAFSTSGYLEIPQILGYLIFLIFIYEEIENKNNLKNKYILFSFIIILLFNFLTKEQSWIILLTIFIFYFVFKKELKKFNFSIYRILTAIVIFICIFFAYYVYNYFYDDYFKNSLIDLIQLISFNEEFHNRANHSIEFINLSSRFSYALEKYPDFLIIPTIALFFTKNKIQNIFTYSFILPYLFFWVFMMSNEIRYLYPLYFFIILFGYKNIIELIITYKKKFFVNKKVIMLFLMTIFLITLVFNNNIKNHSEFLDLITHKKINIKTDPEDINPEFNAVIVNYFNQKTKIKNEKVITNYYLLKYLNIPGLSNIQDNLIYSNLENIKNFDESKYIIIFKNCREFLNKNLVNLKYKKLEEIENSCIISRVSTSQ